jgi:hypothetical protein
MMPVTYVHELFHCFCCYIHCFACLISLTRPIFINIPRSVTFSFENVLDIETVSYAPEFLGDTHDIWDNYCALVCFSQEGRLLPDGFIVESMNSCWYSISITSCLMLLNSSLKSFWSSHISLVLIKLRMIPLFTWYGWLDLKCRWWPIWVGSRYTFVANLGPFFMTKTSKNWRIHDLRLPLRIW